MGDITEIRKMVDEGELECVFYILVNDAQQRLALKDEAAERICQKFMSVVDVSRYGICSGTITRDSTRLRERINALLPVQAEFIIVEPEKDLVRLLTPEQRDWFIEKLKTYNGDTIELALAVLAEDEPGPYCGDIGPYRAEIKQIYGHLRGLLAEYMETHWYHQAPEGAAESDGLAYAARRLEEIRAEAAPLARCSEVAERIEQLLVETEIFLFRDEWPGVVPRWREVNPSIDFFDFASDLLELFVRFGKSGSVDPDDPVDLRRRQRRQDYFAAVQQRFAREGRAYSDDAAFQDELLRTLDLVFRADFGEAWDGATAGA
mgnify:FL=1